MKTHIVTISKTNPDPKVLLEAAQHIKAGDLVAFPTETVYGLGANALNPEAVSKIFKAKNRPSDNPIIVHISDKSDIIPLVKTITPLQKKLMDAFWPGPLTILFEKSDKVSDILTGGLTTVTIRMPSHPVAHDLINLSGVPIAAPSANTSGNPSPTRASHVIQDLEGKISMILDSGQTEFGVESTVINPLSNPPQILRLGAISFEDIQKIIPDVTMASVNVDKPASPGMKYRHYAPKAKVILINSEIFEKEVNDYASSQHLTPDKIGLIIKSSKKKFPMYSYTYESNSDLSQNLFEYFRSFDTLNKKVIFVEKPDSSGLGKTILDRLEKASA